MDALCDVTSRSQARRATIIWTCVAMASVGATLLVYVEWLPRWLRIVSVACGALGFFIYHAWLSTTEIGRSIAVHLRSGI
jgi:hypothetical protein